MNSLPDSACVEGTLKKTGTGGGGGILSIMASTGRFRRKGVPFSGFRDMRG